MKVPKIITLIVLLLVIVVIGDFVLNNDQFSMRIADDLRGNVFEITFPEHVLQSTIHFKDSTYTIYEYGSSNIEWRVPVLGRRKLVMDKTVVAIKKENDSTFSGVMKGEYDTPFILKKKIANWSDEKLIGVWMGQMTYDEKSMIEQNDLGVERIDYDWIPVPDGMDKSDFVYYPYFKVGKNEIIYKNHYDSIVTKYKTIKKDRYMALELENTKPFKANFLKILAQNDTLLCFYWVKRL